MNKIKDFYLKNEKFYEHLIKTALILLLVYVFVMYILELILPFAIGYLLYLILRPVVNKLDKKLKKVNRGLITILSIITFLFIIGFLLYTLGKAIYDQAELFLKSKYYTEQVTDFLDNTIFNIKSAVLLFSKEFSETIVNTIIEGIYSFTSIFLDYAKAISLEVVKALPKFITILIISILSAFFFIKDEEMIIYYYNKILPDDYKKQITKIKNSTGVVTVGYIKAQFILSSITFLICIVGLNLLGNQYAALLSVLVACFDMLPFFGSGFILWPTAFITFLNGDTTKALLTMVLYGTIFLMRQALEPRTLGKQISLHPLFTLLGLYIGVKIFGVGGLIVGPFTVVLVKALLIDEE